MHCSAVKQACRFMYRASAKPFTGQICKRMRWVASMVADVYRILTRGGIFMYPADAKHKEGRLRLLYEANPLAFIAEQAGGLATNGYGRILDVQPTELHERTPLYLGSKTEVELIS